VPVAASNSSIGVAICLASFGLSVAAARAQEASLIPAGTGSQDSVPATAGPRPRMAQGAVVGTVRADTIVPASPILQFTDVLADRIPGVDVQSAGGQSGSGARIVIRGVGSANGSNPIVYLDGIRVDADPGGQNRAETATDSPLVFSAPRQGRLEDLDPGEIERVDVLTGPAATTVYGIDAANGVILVTTKPPTGTQPQWSADAEAGELAVTHGGEPNSYFAWGHATGAPSSIVHCTPLDQAAGSCVVDSITHFSPLSTAMTTPFANGGRDRCGLQVHGGIGRLRYFVSGQRQSETGILEMPPADAQRYASQDGFAPLNGESRPNRLDRTNLRATAAIDLSQFGSLSLFANAIDGDHSAASETAMATSLAFGSSSQSLADGWNSQDAQPRYVFGLESTDHIERYITGANWIWHPLPWLEGRASGGIDHGNTVSQGHIYAIDDPDTQLPGYLGTDRYATHNYSADAVVSATAAPWRGVSAVTSLGLQYRESASANTSIEEQGLINGTNTGIVDEPGYDALDVQQHGAFLEESLSFQDRLFVTGALRVDGTKWLGAPPITAAYPRLAVSWSALRRGDDGLRLRGALGEAGSLPISPRQFLLNSICGIGPCVIGSTSPPLLHPERVREYEAGLDATSDHARITSSLSAYDKTTTGAILPSPDGSDANSGVTQNRGIEASAGFAIVRTGALTWNLDVNAWMNQNKLVAADLPVSPLAVNGLGQGPYYDAVGHSLYAIWEPSVSYHDSNGDGIIEPSEMTLGPLSDQGGSLPTRAVALHSMLGFIGDRVRVGALIGYSGGNRLIDDDHMLQLFALSTRGANDARAPLAQQAQAVAVGLSGTGDGPTYSGPAQDASFVRLRELSLSYVATPALAHALHTGTATFSLLARNVWLWTRYSGVDPEINAAAADPASTVGVTPQPRYFLVRVTLGY
jgi:TonB-dependent SusC/RagA subfamily outer membrane receptor